jgi:sarcosine oxidase
MQSKKTADVVVVGLGAFGSATAYQLAKRGVSVIGIDQFSPPHDRGSSHGATRITRLAVGEGEVYVPIIRRSNEIWEELESVTGDTLVHRVGGLIMGPTEGTVSHHGKPDFVRRSIATAERFSISHEVLDGREVGRRYPQFLTRGDELAYYEPGAGILLPEACIKTQIDQARHLGADIHFGEKVLAIEENASGATVTTTAGEYSAAKVVVTAGPWVPGLAIGAVADNLRVLRQVLYWFETTAPELYNPAKCPIFIWMHGAGDEDYMYGFPMVDGKNGVKVATEQYGETCDPDLFNRDVSDAEAQRMFERNVTGRLKAVLPTTAYRAACMYTSSTDSGFIVDHYRGMRHAVVVSACSGHGFKNSAGLGESIALQIVGKEAPELAPFVVSRFD